MNRRLTVIIAACMPLAGCAGSLAVNEDRDVQSSLQYDSVACDRLVTQRNELARRYGLPTDAKPDFSQPPLGLGPVLPDLRSGHRRDIGKARGEIDAMNRSLLRRQCVKEAPRG